MAQLKDSIIDGNLEVTGDIIFKVNGKDIHNTHPNIDKIYKHIIELKRRKNYG